MNIVHFSRTPMAGSPIRLVRAFQSHTGFDVRLVDKERWGYFDHDLVHSENSDEVYELAEKADVIHLHNYLDYYSKDFYPVDFEKLRRKGKSFVRQFHSHPFLIASSMNSTVKDVLDCPIPSLVIAQFQERFYPTAYVVPNIIPQDAPLYRPTIKPAEFDAFFSYTTFGNAWSDRWNTKGMPETILMIRKLQKEIGFNVKFMSGRPLDEVLEAKQKTRLVVDDLVTGSYHMSGLEGLSLGKPVLTFLDERTNYVLRELSGSYDIPFVNVKLEEARKVLKYLLMNQEESNQIGRAGREWIERFWSDKLLVQHYVCYYEELAGCSGLINRQESLRIDDARKRFFAVTLPDLKHESRKSHLKYVNYGVLNNLKNLFKSFKKKMSLLRIL